MEWSTTKKIACATSASNGEIRAYYFSVKRVKKIRNFLKQIGTLLIHPSPILHALKQLNKNYCLPTSIFENNKGSRDTVRGGTTSARLKYIDVPLRYCHEQHEQGEVTFKDCSTHMMWADTFTKQETCPKHLQARDWYMGKRFHPPVPSQH